MPDGATRLLVTASGGSGGPGLSMNYEAIPDANANDCGLQCDQGFPRSGAWYVKLRGDQRFAGVTLLATLSQPGPLTELADASGWEVVGASAGTSADSERLALAAPQGKLRWTVAAFEGGGAYRLCAGARH